MESPEELDNERDTQYDDFPAIPQGLIEALEWRMPERWPNPEMPDRSIWIRAGQHKVLALLRHIEALQLSQGSSNAIR